MKVWTQEQAIAGASKGWRTLETVGEAVMTDSALQQDRPHTGIFKSQSLDSRNLTTVKRDFNAIKHGR